MSRYKYFHIIKSREDASWINSVSKVRKFRALHVKQRFIRARSVNCILVYFMRSASTCWRKVNCLHAHVVWEQHSPSCRLLPIASSLIKCLKQLSFIYDYISRVCFKLLATDFILTKLNVTLIFRVHFVKQIYFIKSLIYYFQSISFFTSHYV